MFPGDSEIDQMYRIFRTLGTPNETMWPGVTKLKEYKRSFPNWQPVNFRSILPQLDEAGIDLLERMLKYVPSERITAREAVEHPFFNNVRVPAWV
jgi:cyclin-dependent kinase 2